MTQSQLRPSCPSMLNFWNNRVQPLDLSFTSLKGNVSAPLSLSDIIPNGHLLALHVLIFHGTFAIFASDSTVWKFSVLYLCSFCLSVCFLLPEWHPAILRSFNLLTIADTTTLTSSLIPLRLMLSLSQSRILHSLGPIYSPAKNFCFICMDCVSVLLDISLILVFKMSHSSVCLVCSLPASLLPPWPPTSHPWGMESPSFLPGLGDRPEKSNIWLRMLGMFPVCFLTDHQNHVAWDALEELLLPVFFIYMKECLNGMAICMWFGFQCLSILWPVCVSCKLGII